MRQRNQNSVLLALTLACLALAGVCRAAGVGDLTKGTNTEVQATAEYSYYLPKDNSFVFETNVVVKIGDRALHADKAVAYQDATGKGTKYVATGHVRLETPDRMVSGDKCVLDLVAKTVRITGSPRVQEKGGREITATAIVYDFAQEKLSFEGRPTVRVLMDEDAKKNWDNKL